MQGLLATWVLECVVCTETVLSNVEVYGPHQGVLDKKEHRELTVGSQIKTLKLPFIHGDN